MKKVLLALLIAALALFAPMAFMEETGIVDYTDEAQTVSSTPANDPEALFEGYVEGLFSSRVPRRVTGSRLTGKLKNAYQLLKASICQVASGEISSTEFSYPVEAIYSKTTFTAEELGVEQIVQNGEITAEAINALPSFSQEDLSTLLSALMSDCPYDLYWYNKTTGGGTKISTTKIIASMSDGVWTLTMAGDVTFTMSVCEAFQLDGSDIAVDSTWAQTAISAAQTAKDIVAQNANKSDTGKLFAYKSAICALVGYNYDAASGANVAYGNPWQLIWVFDGDDSTDVVCEGYAKAFQYLCDLTTFENDLTDCYTVTGKMGFDGGEENHMWNIVVMEDGQNYLADVTNSDAGTVGEHGELFLKGALDGNQQDGYVFATPSGEVTYRYDDGTKQLFTLAELTLSADSYGQGDCGDNALWSLKDGVLTVEGVGDVYAYDILGGDNPAPWAEQNANIYRVVVGEGITSIGARAFYGCGMEALTLPSTLVSIDALAFSECASLKAVALPDGLLSLGEQAFMNDSALETLTLSATLAALPQEAFSGCQSLVSIDIPESVITIEANAFYDCRMLTEATLHSGLESIGTAAFADCQSLKSISLPKTLTELGTRAFSNNTFLKTAKLPGSVETIGASAFEGCSRLASVTMNEGVMSIGAKAFYDCTSLKSIALPESLKTIAVSAFEGCTALKTVAMGYRLETVGAWAFLNCAVLQSIDLPPSVRTIGEKALGFSDATGMIMPLQDFTICGVLGSEAERYAEENEFAFFAYDLGFTATLERGILRAGESTTFTFSWTDGWSSIPSISALTYESADEGVATANGGRLTAIGAGRTEITVYAAQDIFATVTVVVRDDAPLTIPSSVVTIEDEAFMGLSVREIVVPEGVETIGEGAFAGCANLTVLELPDSLRSIADSALGGRTDVAIVANYDTVGQRWAEEQGLLWETP